MAAPRLSFEARIHAALARSLDWVWPEGAAWAYADALSCAPRSAELHFLRGQALARASRWREAMRDLAVAAHLEPTNLDYQGALVLALGHAGRDEALLEALKRFARLRPGEGEVHVLIGTLQRRCGQTAEALRSFRLAVQLAPTPASRRFLLGEMLLGREGWEEAVAASEYARNLKATAAGVAKTDPGRSALNYHPGRQAATGPHHRKRRASRLRALAGRVRELPLLVRDLPLLLRGPFLSLLRRGSAALDREQRVRAIRHAWRRTHGSRASGRAV